MYNPTQISNDPLSTNINGLSEQKTLFFNVLFLILPPVEGKNRTILTMGMAMAMAMTIVKIVRFLTSTPGPPTLS